MSQYVVFDLETSIGSWFGRKASPFNPSNLLVAIGWKHADDQQVHGVYDKTGRHAPDWFPLLVSNPKLKLIVGQNIKFDILWAICKWPQARKAWMEYVARGGNIWDCQLAEYLLQAQVPTAHMLSMDEMSEMYGGDQKVDEVKAMWEAGIDTPDIPEDLLMRYLCGEDLEDGTRRYGDIENTENIFLKQLEKARKRGQLKSIMLNMGSLCASIEMEYNGMFVDTEEGVRQAKILEEACGKLRVELQQYLPENLPFTWNWGSGQQLSALIFGGTIKYQAKAVILDDETGKPTYYQRDAVAVFPTDREEGAYLLIPNDISQEEAEELAGKGLLETYKGGAKKGLMKTKLMKVPDVGRGPKERYEDFFYTFPGMTDPDPKWETKIEGVYQTNADVIEELAERNIPFLTQLTKLNKMDKDLTTYYITTDDKGFQKGMLTLVGPDGLIHPSINHTSTVTGRFSCSKPNLQNIPRADTSDVKKLFKSRFGAEGYIVQSDFSSLEVYIQALLTGDRQLIEDLKSGMDMHCVRVAKKFDIPYEEAVRRCKKDKDAPDFKLWKARRTGCKEFSFQRAYGAGAKAISYATGMPLEDVEQLIEQESARYPGVDRFYERVTSQIQESRIPTQIWKAHPEIRGLNVQLGRGYYSTPDGKKYSYMEYPAPAAAIKRGKEHASFSPPEIKNYVVQGMGGEWAKAAMWLAVRAFYKRNNFDGKALLVNMVHDAQYLDAHKSVFQEASAVLHAAMEAASEFMEQRFNMEVEAPVPSETNYGSSMAEEMPCDELPGFKERVRELRLAMREEYMSGYVPSFEMNEAA